MRREFRMNPAVKKQGRRRSITPTTLPAPDIEIGLRHPVNYTLAQLRVRKCEPFHNRHKEVAASPWGRDDRTVDFILSLLLNS